MSEWQQIETAPTDSTEIWLGTLDRVIVGWWDTTNDVWRSSLADHRIQWEPTHWLPFLIPEPPSLTN